MALSVKQEKFCIEFAKSGNAQQAYKKAGYQCKNDKVVNAAASRLLAQVNIKNRLAELTEEIKNNSIADIQEMQETLTNIIRQQMDEEVLLCDPVSGIQREKKKPAIREVINAINTLGKMQGAFVDNVNISGTVPVVISGADDLED